MLCWEDKETLSQLLSAAQRSLDAAKQAVQDDDVCECHKATIATQDILCEVVDVAEKAYQWEYDHSPRWVQEMTPPCATVELVKPKELTNDAD